MMGTLGLINNYHKVVEKSQIWCQRDEQEVPALSLYSPVVTSFG